MRHNSSGFYEEQLSLLGFGGSMLPVDENGLPDREKCSEIFKTAFNNGVTFFFAPPSDNAETLFGENLSKIDRNEYFLSGGISLSSVSGEDDIEELFSMQLGRLKSGYFDYYIIEDIGNENFDFFINKNIYGFFSGLCAKGKIKHLGFSFCGTTEEWKTLLKDFHWDFIKMDMSCYHWNVLGADTFYHDIRKAGIPFIASDPFMGGLILDPPEEIFDILKKGDPLLSMEEWALRWFYDKKGLLCILTDPAMPEELSEYADILSSEKTLNSTKKHFIKLAFENFCSENCGDAL